MVVHGEKSALTLHKIRDRSTVTYTVLNVLKVKVLQLTPKFGFLEKNEFSLYDKNIT